jgi:hypothetical protein
VLLHALQVHPRPRQVRTGGFGIARPAGELKLGQCPPRMEVDVFGHLSALGRSTGIIYAA